MKRRRSSFAVQEGRACDSKRLAICGSVRMTCRASLVPNATLFTRCACKKMVNFVYREEPRLHLLKLSKNIIF